MEDFIVIILTLVVMVVGAIGQFRKKQQTTGDVENENSKGTPDFWETFLNGNEEDSFEFEEPDFVESEIKPEVVETRGSLPSEVSEEGLSVFKNKRKYKNDIKNNEIGSENENETVMDDFSLRKAVIYSEIINSKYF